MIVMRPFDQSIIPSIKPSINQSFSMTMSPQSVEMNQTVNPSINPSITPVSDSDSEYETLLNSGEQSVDTPTNQSNNHSASLVYPILYPVSLLSYPHVSTQVSSSVDPPTALSGRANQRYDSRGRRFICGAVPFRVCEDGQIELLCIRGLTSPVDDFIFPKGGWETFESESECASRECLEEAGCCGPLIAHLGHADVQSNKGKQARLAMYLMQVETVYDKWADQDTRERRWLTMTETDTMIQRKEMREMLERAKTAIRLTFEQKNEKQ